MSRNSSRYGRGRRKPDRRKRWAEEWDDSDAESLLVAAAATLPESQPHEPATVVQLESLALPMPTMLAELTIGPEEQLSAPIVATLSAVPLLIGLPEPPPSSPPRSIPQPVRLPGRLVGAPLPAPRLVNPVGASREILSQANQALNPWREIVLTEEPPLGTRKEILMALLFAAASATLGFALTHGRLAALSPRPAATSAPATVAPVATTAAEDVHFRAPMPGDYVSYVPYAGPAPLGPSEVAGIDVPDLSTVAPSDTPTPEPTLRPTAPPTRADAPAAMAASRTPEPVVAAIAPPTVSTWPPVASRPPETTLEEAWRQVSPAIVRIQGASDPVGGILLADGLVATRWSSLGGAATAVVQTSQGPQIADVLGGLDGTDVALLRMPSGSLYPSAPLAPEAPGPSELLGFTSAQGSTFEQVRVIGAVPGLKGHWRFMGVLGAADSGRVLVNNRGEISALILGKPPSFPGHGENIAVDASVLWQLVQASKNQTLATTQSDRTVFNAQFQAMLASELPGEGAAHGKGTDVVAGQGVGLYGLGMSADTLKQTVGTGDDPVPTGDAGWSILRQPSSQLEFVLAQGRVVAVQTTNPLFTTPQGVGVGGISLNIDLRDQADPVNGQWADGESFFMSPGMEIWASREGKVTRLLVEPASGSDTTLSGPRSSR